MKKAICVKSFELQNVDFKGFTGKIEKGEVLNIKDEKVYKKDKLICAIGSFYWEKNFKRVDGENMKIKEKVTIAKRMLWVSNELGIPMGVEFDIIRNNGKKLLCSPYKFTISGLKGTGSKKFDTIMNAKIGYLLASKYQYELVPFKDRINGGDEYWYIGYDGQNYVTTYNGGYTDKYRLSIGNFFETKEEAEKHELKAIKK